MVYVDGFNLYYGVLKGTPYKWLNIDALVKNLLTNNEIIGIKYFTAPVTDRRRLKNQKIYICALQTMIPYFECIFGYFQEKRSDMRHLNPPPNKVQVLVSEEKGTDVNIAVEIVNDIHTKDFDSVLLISNDGDLERSLNIAKQKGKKIILISPLMNKKARPAHKLVKIADHVYFLKIPNILKKSLLPKSVGIYTCPSHW